MSNEPNTRDSTRNGRLSGTSASGPSWLSWLRRGEWIVLIALLALSFLPIRGDVLKQITTLLIFCILALGLNVIVGYTGMLHLGIAAFFGLGAYTTGILFSSAYLFRWSLFLVIPLSALVACLASLAMAAPVLRLKGDYLALVTLGFGEVTRLCLRNLDQITNGTKTLSPIPNPFQDAPIGEARAFYLAVWFILAVIVNLLLRLERSSLGRAWIAIREDELAAVCTGIRATRVKLAALLLGGGLAGFAGSLFALLQNSTSDPNSYDFNRSAIMLCCLIMGGLGSLRGTLVGVLLLIGFDTIATSQVDSLAQRWITSDISLGFVSVSKELLRVSTWRFMIFGLALVAMMRLRPEGLWPSKRVALEMHESEAQPELSPSPK